MEKLLISGKSFDWVKIDAVSSEKGIRNLFINKSKLPVELSSVKIVDAEDFEMYDLFKQLDEYFRGKRKEFDVPLEIIGTNFQKRVWSELEKINYGNTISYQQLAERLGNVKSIRAAGRANGVNPLPIVVPCHRVIGANGKLVGYGGGLDVKRKLLELEGSFNPDLFY
jgi:methylated-DNA-[protein]-cysteine S-methyltransferase